MLAQHRWAPVLQGCLVMIATDNTTVVSYINKQGGNHSHFLLRLVVEPFIWLQSQDIVIRARHITGCLRVIAARLSRPNQPISTESPSRDRDKDLGDVGFLNVDMFATVHNTRLSQFMFYDSRTARTGSGCTITTLAGKVDVHVSSFPLLNKVIQKLQATQDGEIILIGSWKPSQLWFPHLI